MSKRDLKLIAATLTVLGTLLAIFGKIFGPDEIVWHKAPWYGEVAGSMSWVLLLVAPLVYVALDWRSLFPKKDGRKEKVEYLNE